MRCGCSQEVDTVAEWMEGEKLGAVREERGERRRGGGGPLKERESDAARFLHPQLPASSSVLPPAFHPVSEERKRRASASPSTPSQTVRATKRLHKNTLQDYEYVDLYIYIIPKTTGFNLLLHFFSFQVLEPGCRDLMSLMLRM